MLHSSARRASQTDQTSLRPVRRGVRRLNHRSRRVTAALLVPALVAGLLAAGFAFFSDASDASNPPPLGIYLGYENTSGVSSLGSAIGQQPAYAMDYLDGTSWSTMESSAASEAAAWSGSGYSMTFSVPMLPNSGATLADGASGDYNAYYQQIAQGLVANNEASSIVRIGWEFNGSWMPWYADSSDASEFVSFWQQAVTAMRSVSGANFQFEWCPNGGDTTDNMSSFYPGNSYVDIVAEDVYDQAWGTYPGESQNFSNLETVGNGLNWLTSFAAQQGKPAALGEWGLGNGPGNAGQPYTASNQQVSGGDDPAFIDDMAQWLASNHVYEATYFDYESMALSPQQNPNSYNAFLKDFGPGGVAAGSAGSSPTTPAPPPATTTTTAPPPATTTTTAPPPTTTTTTTTPPPPTTTTTTTTPPPPTTTTTAPPPTTTTTAPPPTSTDSPPPPPTTTTTTTTPPPPTTTTTTTTPPPPTTTTTAPSPTTTTTTAPPPTSTDTPPPPTTTTTTTTTTTPPTDVSPPAPSGPPPGSMTITTLQSSADSATVGDESTIVFTVTVTPAVNETVGVYGDGGLFKLCQVTVTTADGSGTCALGDEELGPVLYLAGAVTLSGSDFMGSFSNPVTFVIDMPSGPAALPTSAFAGPRGATGHGLRPPRQPRHRSGSRPSTRRR